MGKSHKRTAHKLKHAIYKLEQKPTETKRDKRAIKKKIKELTTAHYQALTYRCVKHTTGRKISEYTEDVFKDHIADKVVEDYEPNYSWCVMEQPWVCYYMPGHHPGDCLVMDF